MVILEPEDECLLVYWQAILDRATQEWSILDARPATSDVDSYFYSTLMYPYRQIQSTARCQMEEIVTGKVQWHRHERERRHDRQVRLEQAQPGYILHHRHEGDFILVRRNKVHFRVKPVNGGEQRTLPQDGFLDASPPPSGNTPSRAAPLGLFEHE